MSNKELLISPNEKQPSGISKALSSRGFGVDPVELGQTIDPYKRHEKCSEDDDCNHANFKLKELGFIAGLEQKLRTSATTGIRDAEIPDRILEFGSNARNPPKTTSVWELIKGCFEDDMLQLLLLAAFVSLIIGIINDGFENGWIEGSSIFLAVFIITIVTVSNNYAKEKQFQKLQQSQRTNQRVTVLRNNGAMKEISSQDIVVGDIYQVMQGMEIPADSILIKSDGVTCDESSLTGETKELEKKVNNHENYHLNLDCTLIGKTFVKKGSGLAMAVCVGPRSRSGMIQELLNVEEKLTPLQEKLNAIVSWVGNIGMTVAGVTFVIMTCKLVYKEYIIKNCSEALDPSTCVEMGFIPLLKEIVRYFIVAVTVVVVAIPEGLPLAVTISLAYSVAKMQKGNCLVRKIEASETMGGANQVVTDKTGTLTTNEMTVRGLYTMDQMYIETKAFDEMRFQDLGNKDMMVDGVLYNCTAHVEVSKTNGKPIVVGNASEQGIIRFFLKNNLAPIVENSLTIKEKSIICNIPFDSQRKKSLVAISLEGNQNVRVFVKGAPEFLLDICTQYMAGEFNPQELTEEKKAEILNKVIKLNFAPKALRTIMVAYKDMPLSEFNELKASNNNFEHVQDKQVLEQGLTMICIYGLQDPLRDNIREAIAKCHAAGINVRMCTGDNIDTAKAIAKDAGILPANFDDTEDIHEYTCMTGHDFEELVIGSKTIIDDDHPKGYQGLENFKAFLDIEKHLKVLARSSPEHKRLLVIGLQQKEAVVAVTGDGTNDAPALVTADVGFAMGIAGTEVAKNASDIIITDDNFASIVTAVLWGRGIYSNVRKFLQFQFTVNVVALLLVFIGSIWLTDPTFTSVQMLWVNLIMDTCGALALATEEPDEILLKDAPHARSSDIMNAVMYRNIFGQAIYQIAVLLTLLFAGQDLFGLQYDENISGFYMYVNGEQVSNQDYTNKLTLYTIIFHSFVFMQIFNEINSRKLGDQEYNVFKGFFNNALFLGIIVGTLLVQTALVEYGGAAVRTIPLTLDQHLICLGIGFFSLINGLITKKLLKPQWFAWIRIKEDASPEEAEKSISRIIRQPSRVGAASKKEMHKHVSTHPEKGITEPLLVNPAINN